MNDGDRQLIKRQRVLADFGEFALGSDDIDEVLTEACRLVADALGTRRAKVLEIQAGGDELLLRAGVGWRPEIVGHERLEMSEYSSETFAIREGVPVICRDIAHEARFEFPDFMTREGVRALANVPIFVPGRRAYGILQVDAQEPRDFSNEDTEFLRTYATILGPVIDRLHKIERLRSSEERQGFLLAVSDALRPIKDPVEVQRTATRMLGVQLRASRVFYVVVDDDGDTADILGDYTDGVPTRVGRYSLSGFSSDALRQWRAGQIASTPDVDADASYSESERRAYASVSTRAGIGVPLIKEGRLVALLGVNQSTPRRWTDQDLQLAAEIAERTWAAVERARAEAALRESEARHRLLIGSWAQAVWEADAAGVVVTDSPSWRAYTGQTLEEWLGYGWLNAIHSDDRAYAERQWREAIAARGLVDAEFRLRAPGGEWRWTNVRAAPVLDGKGRVEKWASMNIDIDARKQAEAALREREADLARVQRIGGVGGLDIDVAAGLTIRHSPEYLRLHGLPPTHAREMHAQWRERVHPEDRERAERELLAALEGEGRSYEAEYRIVRPSDGAERWIYARADIERDANGKPLRLIGAHLDVTEQKLTQNALAASEERLRGFGEASTDILWIRDAETLQWTYLTPAFEEIYGLSREDALAGNDFQRWTELIVPEDREHALNSIRRVRDGERVTFEYRIRRPSDGTIRRVQNTDFPIQDAEGRVYAVGGVGHDVTDERAMSERQMILFAEVQHRTRNLLGVVRAMADRTAVGAATLIDFLPPFRDRLGALSRVNTLLSRLESGERVTFDKLIRDELDARGVLDNDKAERVVLDGPADVRLRSATVQTFALAIHELATNAVKYGALSDGTGQLRVLWRLHQDEAGRDRLRVDWTESGVVDMPEESAAPRGGGYGRMLIERALPYQLGATTTYELGSDGVRCSIDLPLR